MKLISLVEVIAEITSTIEKTNRLRRVGPPGPRPSIYADDVYWDERRHHWVRDPKRTSIRSQASIIENRDEEDQTKTQKDLSEGFRSLNEDHDLTKEDIYRHLLQIVNNQVDYALSKFDDMLRDFAAARWGDQSIPVVSGEVFDALPGEVILRGLTDASHLDSNLNGEVFGNGIYGNGQYFTGNDQQSAEVAFKFGDISTGGHVFTAKINPEAKLIHSEDLSKIAKEIHKESSDRYSDIESQLLDHITDRNLSGFFNGDQGRIAAFLGFDGIIVADPYDHEDEEENEDKRYFIILNQRALVADQRSMPDGELNSHDVDDIALIAKVKAYKTKMDEKIYKNLRNFKKVRELAKEYDEDKDVLKAMEIASKVKERYFKTYAD